MSDIAMPGTFRLADVFGKTIAIYRRRFPAFIVLTVIVSIPYYLAVFAYYLGGVHEYSSAFFAMISALGVLGILTQSLASGAVMHGVVQDLRGRTFSVDDSLRTLWRHLMPMLGVAICTTLLIVMGMLLLLVPGIILACAYFVSTPVCIAEQAGVFASMSRSGFLTRGYRWPVFGMLLLLYVAGLGLNGIVSFATEPMGAAASLIFDQALAVVVGAFEGVLTGVVYYDLRVAKEGIDIDKIAGVFD